MFKVDLDYEIRKCHKREIVRKLANKLAYYYDDIAYHYDLGISYIKPYSREAESLYKMNFEIKFAKEVQEALSSITYNVCQVIEDLLIESAEEILLEDEDINEIIDELNNTRMEDKQYTYYNLLVSEKLENNIKSLVFSRYLNYKPTQQIKVRCSNYIIKFDSKALIRPLLDNYEITNCKLTI